MPKTKKDKIEKDEIPGETKNSYYSAVGRRKESIAVVKLFVANEGEVNIAGKVVKKGETIINGRPLENYFPMKSHNKIVLEPFRTTNTVGRYAVSAVITGGGMSGQVGAFILGVSRALEKVDKEKFRPILKKKNFLTRDARIKERRKAGFAQKARATKQSPKR